MTLRMTPTGVSQDRDQTRAQHQQQQTQTQTQQNASSPMYTTTTPNPNPNFTATSTSISEIASPHPPSSVTLLILGAGWTYQFLHPVLSHHHKVTYAETTTTGRDGTIPFKFDPDSNSNEQFKALPQADYVLITFPLKGVGQSAKLVRMYNETHAATTTPTESSTQTSSRTTSATKWIQLGSTGIFTAADWNDSSSPIDESNTRGVAERELIQVANGCILNLAGLYGANRNPRNWVSRVAKTKDQLAAKGAVHLIHGEDVARAVVGVILKDLEQDQEPIQSLPSSSLFGRRWIVADCVSYDWWSLVWDWMGESNEPQSDNETETGRNMASTSGTVETVQTATASDEQRRQQQREDPSKTTTETDTDTIIKRQYRQWILELMEEHHVRGLPRSIDQLGRKLDARDFWKAVGILPKRSLAR
ncbi:hypothetical protein ABEF92_000745 [Exophiala dermatitidis]|uniref:Uncharacterized protein n=1 Tax=Exophiala dermatitidis (strain ATCC 34100 / CBS 525.76 / NIH/UT8656) TaxID=858893 RepID=H6BNV5_EXODN|nr:uncharacterized protein HMPREF1120_00504 [Exophiala dermatitidis NIH/UT8656]EHY52290.1 hypothetical protein HMPREF1120_00504 [Exophiala dermatitidis NIH/UT8656]